MNRKIKWGQFFLSTYGWLFLAFIYAPILLISVYSFNSNPVNMMIWEGFTFSAVLNSLTVAFITTGISTVFGTSVALAVARFKFRLKSFYRALMFMPMIMPDIILGIALLIFFVSFRFGLGLHTIIIGHCTFLSSYVFIVVSARIADMDGWVTFRRVTLPMIAPGVIGGALLAFIISMDDLVITYFISGVNSTTLPVHIYGMLRRGIKPEINAIATIILLFSFGLASVGLYMRGRKR